MEIDFKDKFTIFTILSKPSSCVLCLCTQFNSNVCLSGIECEMQIYLKFRLFFIRRASSRHFFHVYFSGRWMMLKNLHSFVAKQKQSGGEKNCWIHAPKEQQPLVGKTRITFHPSGHEELWWRYTESLWEEERNALD